MSLIISPLRGNISLGMKCQRMLSSLSNGNDALAFCSADRLSRNCVAAFCMAAADFCDATIAAPVNAVISAAATASLSAVSRLIERPPTQRIALFEGDAHPEVEAGVAVDRSGDVERQADDGQVQVGAAADAALEGLVGQFLAGAVNRSPVDEGLDAETADVEGRRDRDADLGRRGREI